MDGLPEPDMPKADVILYTHHHQDHIKTATLQRLATDQTTIIAPAKCRELIGREFDVITPGEERRTAGYDIRAVHAYNTPEGASTRKQHKRGECVGYLVSYGGKTIYHAGDTDLIPEMADLGHIDVAFLPIGGTFTMNIAEAAEAAAVINADIAIPIHFLAADPVDFMNLVTAKGYVVQVLNTGETIEL